MLISKYSAPDFNPYDDDDPIEPNTLWPAPQASAPLDAVVTLPGSKSLTNRELVLSALATEPSLLVSPLRSRDTDNMAGALRSLGVRVDEVAAGAHDAEGPDARAGAAHGPDWRVVPDELVGSTTIDCGMAGTVMRFIPPLAGLALGPTTIDAEKTARTRPMATMIDALRTLGVDVADDRRGRLPFTVHGTGAVTGGEVQIDASASSQFVSGLLLAAARFDHGLHLRHVGERLPSMPHIEMTIAALAARGVEVHSPSEGEWLVEPGPIAGTTTTIEPDLSNAAPFLAAALVTGGRVRVTGWPQTTTQVGADLAELLPRFGATVQRAGDSLVVTGGPSIRGVKLDLSTGGELAPTLVALAALAEGQSEITGIGHIRHHETDRLAALAAEINGLGGEVTELEDGLRITPRPLTGGTWRSYHDHRMATTGALIGLAVPGVEIEDVGTTAKTLPQFTALWQRMLSGRLD